VTKRELVGRVAALSIWGYATWLLLTWTATLEMFVSGAVIAVMVAIALAPLGPVARPWAILWPPRLLATIVLTMVSAAKVVKANLLLARFIWSPRPPLTTGMVITDTTMRSEGGLAGVGVLTSLIVDNQVVDVDRERHELLYHVLQHPDGGRAGAYEAINGPVERRIAPLAGRVAARPRPVEPQPHEPHDD
jgi:multicomponent Na+:H+ antiporter subunit E